MRKKTSLSLRVRVPGRMLAWVNASSASKMASTRSDGMKRLRKRNKGLTEKIEERAMLCKILEG
jgi:hypothetical protein